MNNHECNVPRLGLDSIMDYSLSNSHENLHGVTIDTIFKKVDTGMDVDQNATIDSTHQKVESDDMDIDNGCDIEMDDAFTSFSTGTCQSLKYNTVVLSGGGILGYMHIGFLDYLFEADLLQLETIVGASVGSLLSFMLCLGMSVSNIKESMDAMNSQILDIKCITDLVYAFGLDKGEYFGAYLMDIMIRRGIDPRITLLELYQKSGINLVITVTNLSTTKTMFVNHTSHPHLHAVTAVTASCSIPILVKPVVIDNEYWIDGGISCNFPLNYCFQQESWNNVIASNITNWKPVVIDSFGNYMTALLSCLLGYNKNDIVYVQSMDISKNTSFKSLTVVMDNSDVALMDVDCSMFQRQVLMDFGYTNTERAHCV